MSLWMPTHASKLERWLGKDEVEHISRMNKNWYGPPIPISGVPGKVFVTSGGDFVGPIRGGHYANVLDYKADKLNRAFKQYVRKAPNRLHGFSSLSDLISEATTGGKRQDFWFNKVGTVAASTGQPMSLWPVGVYPPAGGVGGTSGTGVVPTNVTSGAIPFTNPAGGDTLHFTTGFVASTTVNTLMMYDRLWHMTYNHATSVSTAVDAANRPNRYTGTAAAGNFFCGEVTTALSATAHNMTVTYVDENTNAAEAAAAYAAPVSAAANRLTLVSPNWFMPLNGADKGIQYATIVAQSTITSVTGITSWFIGRPLAFMPAPIANLMSIIDGINSAFNMVEIKSNACLAFLEMPKTATTATTYNGDIVLVSG